jgi:hypothetical protein
MDTKIVLSVPPEQFNGVGRIQPVILTLLLTKPADARCDQRALHK